MPTQRDIALSCGLSQAAVSLALRNDPSVPKETRDRVQRVAATLGYRVNPLVASLMSTRRRRPSAAGPRTSVAILTKFDQPVAATGIDTLYYGDLWRGLHSRADELGLTLDEIPYRALGLSAKTIGKILRTLGVQGIVLFPGGKFSEHFPAFDISSFSVIEIGFHESSFACHQVAADYTYGMNHLLAFATDKGYRRIGLAMGGQLDPNIRYAFSGPFLSWQARHVSFPVNRTFQK